MASWVEREVSVEGEFSGAMLGDGRRQARLIKLAQAVAAEPAASFPKATRSHAALEAAYRLLRNDAVSLDGILAGHYAQTVERAASEASVLAVHDTTQFEFKGEGVREGLGPLLGHGQGFFGHFTLLVAPGELKRPLGVIALQAIVRPRKRSRGSKSRRSKEKGAHKLDSGRWTRGVEIAQERLEDRCPVVHVMDRECDSYALWAALIETQRRFVVRNSRDRVVEDGVSLVDVLSSAVAIVEREVPISRRREERIHFNRRRHPAREARIARLAISAQTVTIRRPGNCVKELPETLTLNFVQVREVGTSGDEKPVDWTLATTEPIDTLANVERVVDNYRSRWVIEEYFKALKTGCAFERRQLESKRTLFNALGLLIPIAWRLLLIRSLSRNGAPDASATEVLSNSQLEVLVATSREPLPAMPTVQQALLAIAKLGGHIKNNGPPGWIVLGRGLETLFLLEQGWKAARRCDQ